MRPNISLPRAIRKTHRTISNPLRQCVVIGSRDSGKAGDQEERASAFGCALLFHVIRYARNRRAVIRAARRRARACTWARLCALTAMRLARDHRRTREHVYTMRRRIFLRRNKDERERFSETIVNYDRFSLISGKKTF